jgi:hypothetical protein
MLVCVCVFFLLRISHTFARLRTLEFWVDNLNPLFLYPEMSKQTELFSSLMQALSHHLRPAPYPYGLLTLRLLGKLGGKNRQFLREPILLCEPNSLGVKLRVAVDCSWTRAEYAMDESDRGTVLSLDLPLSQCVEILKTIAMTHPTDEKSEAKLDGVDTILHRGCSSRLWECKIEDLEIASYSKEVIDDVKRDQAMASMAVIRTAVKKVVHEVPAGVKAGENPDRWLSEEKLICMGLLYAGMVDATKNEAGALLKDLVVKVDHATLAASLAFFLSEPSNLAIEVGLDLLGFLLGLKDNHDVSVTDMLFESLICSMCEMCCSSSWGRQNGPQEAICKMTATLGREWSRKHEVKLVNATLLPVKTVPRELAEASLRALRVFIHVCSTLYGEQWSGSSVGNRIVWDVLSSDEGPEMRVSEETQSPDTADVANDAKPTVVRPSEEVFRITIYELTSPQQLVRYDFNSLDVAYHLNSSHNVFFFANRFAARFLLNYFVANPSTKESDASFVSGHVDLIRRVLFSRSLRLLPLPHQVGVVEGLAAIIKQFPSLLPLTDQHLLNCLSELLKMSSVADGEMTDEKLNEVVVDKDGFVPSEVDSDSSQYPTHASSLFFRRDCVVDILGVKIVVPGELPAGVQLRVSTIVLLHGVIRTHTDPFFDAESTTPIGKFLSFLFVSRSMVVSR